MSSSYGCSMVSAAGRRIRRGGAEFAAVHDLISEYEIRGFEFPGTEIAPYFEMVMQIAREFFATRDDEKKRELGEAIMKSWEAARTRQQ